MRGRFLIAFCLMAGALVLGLVAMSVSGPASAQEPVPAPVQYYTPTPEALLRDGCFIPLALQPGDTAYIRAGIIVRYEPNISSAIMHYTDVRTAVIITEGPVCANGYNWWRVSGTENPGWVAEGTPDSYFIQTGIPPVSDACVSVFPLRIGGTADLMAGMRVREEPNLTALVLTVAPAGSQVEIIGGPLCAEGMNWWQVRAVVVGFTYEGWMAEGSFGVQYVLPDDRPSLEDGTLCALPLGFGPGTRAFVNYRDGVPKYLRSAPGTNEGVALFSLVRYVPFIVVGGPVCRDNMNWWQIRVLASTEVTGWMAEGSPGIGYWMRELTIEDYPRPQP